MQTRVGVLVVSTQRFTSGAVGGASALFLDPFINQLTGSGMMTAVIEIVIAALCLLNPLGLSGFPASLKVGLGGGLAVSALVRLVGLNAGGS